MPLISAGIAGAGLLYQGISSGIRGRKAKQGLEELNKTSIEEVSVSPEMQRAYNRAEGMSRYGFSPEETAAFNQSLARNQATQFQTATDMSGGNLSSAIGGVLQANNIGAINQFAAQGSQRKLANIQYADQLAGAIQGIKDRKVEDSRQRRMMLESQYGGAIRQQQENINQTIGGAVRIASQFALGSAGARTGAPSTDGMASEIPTITSGDYAGQPQSLDPTSSWNNRERVIGSESSDVVYQNMIEQELLQNPYQTVYGTPF